ncbi:Arginine permease [Candida viswanathii]|uniref:Arginine permease n=1 Tax=Candida viswanathii TaxID=5486 RepID=A0A367Y161_9ASCO|nr:Arginine permease [Candida viswanathii]
MISIGGLIGTGLFIGVRVTLLNGPIISLCSYIYISLICYYIIQAVGEMSIYMPLNGSLCQFLFKFISNPVGVVTNFIYWISWSITLALELSLIYNILANFKLAIIEENETAVIFVMWLAPTVVNLLPVNNYGNVEFVITIFKVLFMIGWICLSATLILYQGDGFKYWNRDLIWGIEYIKVVKNPIGSKIINILSSLVSSCFTFQSIESIAICSGEIKDVNKNLPKAIKYVVLRIVVFYILTLFLLTLMIPCDDPRLTSDDDGIFASPFILALSNLNSNGYFLLAFNFIILLSMISAANSNIYFGSRCLLSMVEEDYFPEMFAKTTSHGVPYNAVLLTSAIGLISLFSKFKSIDAFYKLLINLSSTSGLVMWLCILVAYLQFRKALQYNSLEYEKLSYVAGYPMIVFSYFTIVSIIVVILGNGIVNIWDFNWDSFISCYLTLVMLVIGSYTLSVLWEQPLLRPVDQVDIFTDQSPLAFK